MDDGKNINNNGAAPVPEFGSEEWIGMKQNEMSAHAAELVRQEAEKVKTREIVEPEVNINLRSERTKEIDGQDDGDGNEVAGGVVDDFEIINKSAIAEQATEPIAENTKTAEAGTDTDDDAAAESSHETEVDEISIDERLKDLDAKFDDLQKSMIEQMEALTNQIEHMSQQMHNGLRMFDMLANQYSDSLETGQQDDVDDVADAYLDLPKLKNNDVINTYVEMLNKEEKPQEV